jgi:hypothetical protein
MIPNALTVLIGLWLAYSAVFSSQTEGVSDLTLGLSGAAVAVLAIAARRFGPMAWQSTLNTILGAALTLYAVARWQIGPAGFETFWTALLGGIVASIGSLWSILYKPGDAKAAGTAS